MIYKMWLGLPEMPRKWDWIDFRRGPPSKHLLSSYVASPLRMGQTRNFGVLLFCQGAIFGFSALERKPCADLGREPASSRGCA